MEIKSGLYRHSKSGNKVKVIGVAKHSETLEDFVVYDHLDTNDLSDLWIRPTEMFIEDVEINGERKPRFQYLGEE